MWKPDKGRSNIVSENAGVPYQPKFLNSVQFIKDNCLPIVMHGIVEDIAV